MTRLPIAWFLLLSSCLSACASEDKPMLVVDPPGSGAYAVGTTNMEVATEYAAIGDEVMHAYLLGRSDDDGQPRFVIDLLAHPESAWIVDVPVPADEAMYGPASGLNLPVVSFVAYPAQADSQKNAYTFPYFGGQYGSFADMLAAGEKPRFADANRRYPLVLLSHGGNAHGLYDVRHAQAIASHGYIVAVITYGDERTAVPDSPNIHTMFLRPLITKAVLDSLLASEEFGPRIDAENMGITGHSFGGFTALAVLGGPILGNESSVSDNRIKAAVLAAPFVGGRFRSLPMYMFGDENAGLEQVTAPTLWFFGTNDEVTPANSILPAARRVSGPRYLIELVDQPHVFEGGSWQDRDNWELLFFNAYLKSDAEALEAFKTGHSMGGGNEDRQLFDYQSLAE